MTKRSPCGAVEDRYHACPDALERFWAKVDNVSSPDGCWLWLACQERGGYGRFSCHKSATPVVAHRYAYTTLVGPVPEGLQLDHLCRVRRCVNPAHLEPVTPRENQLRGETFAARKAGQALCVNGHDLDKIDERGRRRCSECARRHTREYMRRQRYAKSEARAQARIAQGLPPDPRLGRYRATAVHPIALEDAVKHAVSGALLLQRELAKASDDG